MDGADCQIRNDEEGQDDEGADSHGPAVAHLANKPGYHDGEDDTSDAGSCCENAKCGASLDVEPAVNGAESWDQLA